MFKALFLCLALGLVPYASNADPLNSDILDVVPDAAHQLPASMPINSDLAVNENGYVFPFFRNWRSINADLAQKLKTDFEAAMLHLDKVISQSLVSVQGVPKIKKRTMMHDLHAGRIASALKTLRQNNKELVPFIKMASAFFHRLLQKAKVIEKELIASNEAKNPTQLKDDIHKRIVDLNSIFNQSPVVLFFDWENGSMDGESAEKSLSKLMARVRYHGLGKILTIVDTFLGMILGLSKLG